MLGVSYDLYVYAPDAAEGVRLRQLVSGVSSLDVGELDESRGWCTVVRGTRRNHCFTIDGPIRLEPADVPDEVMAVLLGATDVFHVSVEGSAAPDIPHAVRFARRLAQSLGGVVVDQQLDEVWAKGATRQAAKPARGERVRVIDLSWYVQSERVGDDFSARYLALCRRLLPEALPRRYGEYEPLQGKLADGGDDAFRRAWREVTSTFFFMASPPCIAGSMGAGPAEQHPRPFWHMSLEVHCKPFAADMRWRDALRRLFVAIANESGAFYASAEVTRGHIWNGRSAWSDGSTEWAIMPARTDGWMGLPPYPTWWAWYGSLYRPLVHDRIPFGAVTEHGSGVLHELAEEPADRDDLTRAVTRRRGLRRVAEWVPSDLLARVQPNDGRVQPVPLGLADTIPPALR